MSISGPTSQTEHGHKQDALFHKKACGYNKDLGTKFLAGVANDQEVNPVGYWPWMASIGYYTNGQWIHQCGATLITHRHFLTAAHCIRDT